MTTELKTLLVDDDKNIRRTLSVSLASLGCKTVTVDSVDAAIQALKVEPFDFVLTDFKLGERTGIDLLSFIKKIPSPPISVVMTAFASFDNAVNAVKEGAFDYLPKPFSTAQLELILKKVKSLVQLKKENDLLKTLTFREDYFKGMTSVAMIRLEEFVNNMAPSEATILMIGESGTGKSDLAKIIHQRSKRASRPFVVINCTSLAESLLESELFGHVKGSFTGAIADHPGKFEIANHGTVFLDEIGDLSLNGQAKLLRVLQEKVIERVGSNKSLHVDVRVIAATNKSLEEAVKNGTFREDLYYRLNVFECSVVPLRHRKEDIPVLIGRFLHGSSIAAGELQDKALSEDLLQTLIDYDWPGNIRELKNVIERMVFLSRGREISDHDLPPSLKIKSGTPMVEKDGDTPLVSIEELEKKHIQSVLRKCPNQEQAAEILGITTVTLWRKRKQYGIP